MKKRIGIIFVSLAMVLSLSACGPQTCKEEGCDDTNIYQDGYCKYHYTLHNAKQTVDDAAKGIFDSVDSKTGGALSGLFGG